MQSSKSIRKVLGITFVAIGLGGATIGGIIAYILSHSMLITFIPIGAFDLFFLTGVILFMSATKEVRSKRILMEKNQYVMAEIVKVYWDSKRSYAVEQMELHPYRILCEYRDSNGATYQFESKPLLYNPTGLITSNQLRVFVDLQKPKEYYVDTTSILSDDAFLHKFKNGIGSEKLKEQGQFILATTCGTEIAGVIYVAGVARVGPKGYQVLCKYQASDGSVHIFASNKIEGEPTRSYVGEQVRVYYTGKNYCNYYVDL